MAHSYHADSVKRAALEPGPKIKGKKFPVSRSTGTKTKHRKSKATPGVIRLLGAVSKRPR